MSAVADTAPKPTKNKPTKEKGLNHGQGRQGLLLVTPTIIFLGVIIIYPLLIPLLIAAIELTKLLLTNQPPSPSDFLWAKILIVFDLVFTALAVVLADTILVN